MLNQYDFIFLDLRRRGLPAISLTEQDKEDIKAFLNLLKARRSRRRVRSPAVTEEFDEQGNHREQDDAERDEGEVVSDDGHVAERVTGEGADTDPDQRAGDVVERE